MPRKGRIDAPGALHHVIVRGIGRGKIFRSDYDRRNFLNRLGKLIPETQTDCFAWALIPNHVHLLLRTGSISVSVLMSRLLTGYAVWFNKKYRRHGQLFQNRYKSILCQEDPYLKELVRYIHLNPLRAGLVEDMKKLDKHPWCGHSVLMNKTKEAWQNVDYVYGLFSEKRRLARTRYRVFVEKGILEGKRPDLTVKARSLLCFWAHRKLGMTTIEIGKRLNISQSAVSRSSMRGQKIAKENQLELID